MKTIQNLILILFLMALSGKDQAQSNPWKQLQEVFPEEDKKTEETEQYDPWAEMRKVFLPFTATEEEEALTDSKKAASFSNKIIKPLKPYLNLIKECSKIFDVPQEIIGAVVLVESGGNPKASASTSSAKGLMQTIKSTFRDAYASLKAQGIKIKNDPFNPRASLYAGTWYLNHVFGRVQKDNPSQAISRFEIEDWCTPAKYYYAGPGWGAQKEEIIITYIDGKKLVVDKQTYCRKVMQYARLLRNVME